MKGARDTWSSECGMVSCLLDTLQSVSLSRDQGWREGFLGHQPKDGISHQGPGRDHLGVVCILMKVMEKSL